MVFILTILACICLLLGVFGILSRHRNREEESAKIEKLLEEARANQARYRNQFSKKPPRRKL